MNIIFLDEMAHLGDVRTKSTYRVYYRFEGETKHDHVHLKQNNQDKVEFWAVDNDTFEEKRFPKGLRLLKESEIKRLAEILTKEKYIELIRNKAIKSPRGEFYPVPVKKVNEENQKEMTKSEQKDIKMHDAMLMVQEKLADELGISLDDATQVFYSSKLFKKMSRYKGKLSESEVELYFQELLREYK